MTEIINMSSNISDLLLLKYNDFLLKSQQPHSNGIDEIAKKMHVKFISFNHFSDIHEIRSDLYGDNVRKAIWNDESRPVILKSVPGYSIEEHLKKLTEEIERSLYNKTCENIIQLLGITEDVSDKSAVLVIQHPKDGTLREYLAKHPNLDWTAKLNLAKDIAHGLRHLHRSGICHGDLHEQSVFIDNGRAVIRDPKLFGFEDDETSSSSTLNSTVISTIPFVDPQVMGDMKHKPDQRSDIYSFGVILWEISSGIPPFHNSQYGNGNQVLLTMAIMVRKTREQPVPNTPEEYVQLYQQCWDQEPDMRPNIEQVYDQLEDFLYGEPFVTGKSLSNNLVIADIRVSSEESRKSHDYPSFSSSQLQNPQNETNEQPLHEKSSLSRISKYQDANLSVPVSPKPFAKINKPFAKINKNIGKPKIIKKLKSKISKILKKMSCFS